MQTPPEIQNTDEKLADAAERRDELQARVDRLRAQWMTAVDQTEQALQRLDAAPKAISDASHELAMAMREGSPVEKLQQKVSAAQSNIAACKTLFEEAQANQIARWEAMAGPSKALGQMLTEYANARMYDLIAKIAALAIPMRPLCDELRTLAPSLGVSLGDSGFLLDESRPNIGPYELCRDGSMRHIFFKNQKRSQA